VACSRCNKHWTGHEGINLPQEVGPQAVRKISSQLPTEGYRRNEIDGRNEHTSGSGARRRCVAAAGGSGGGGRQRRRRRTAAASAVGRRWARRRRLAAAVEVAKV
jgi:hypothetical protein